MSTGTKIPLDLALTYANRIVDHLRPCCTRIGITGSIRRQKPMVGDIEIVFEPRLPCDRSANHLVHTPAPIPGSGKRNSMTEWPAALQVREYPKENHDHQ